jgi:outer membrane lipoprotein-sorting protein
MKTGKFIIIALFLSVILAIPGAYGQGDGAAAKILDEFMEKTLKAPSVSIDFTIIMSSLKDEVIDEFDGHLTLKGEKYKLNIMETESWFDGRSIYTYMPDINEVMISDPDEDGGILSNPAQLFSGYEEQFRYRLVGETTREGARLYEIDLHPIERDHDFHTVKLFIKRDDSFLHSAVIAGKDGNRYTFLVNSYDNTRQLPDSFFVFNESDHPGVEVIDMRW